jgi:hypothetical protein
MEPEEHPDGSVSMDTGALSPEEARGLADALRRFKAAAEAKNQDAKDIQGVMQDVVAPIVGAGGGALLWSLLMPPQLKALGWTGKLLSRAIGAGLGAGGMTTGDNEEVARNAIAGAAGGALTVPASSAAKAAWGWWKALPLWVRLALRLGAGLPHHN